MGVLAWARMNVSASLPSMVVATMVMQTGLPTGGHRVQTLRYARGLHQDPRI